MKRILALAMVLAIVVSLLPVHGLAAEQKPVFTVETVEAKAGDAVTVKILADNNPGIASVKLLAEYDESKLTLTKIEYNKAWGGMSQAPQKMDSPVTLTWFDGAQNYGGEDPVFVTLTFQVKENAAGNAEISITYDPEDVYNISETNVDFEIENGKVVISGGEAPEAGQKPVFSVSTAEGKAGETVEVTLSAKNNPGIASVKFLLEYDPQKLELTDISYNSAWGGMFQQPQTKNSPVTLTWFDGAQDYTEKEAVFATLTFRVLAGASGEAAIHISYDPEDVYNISEKNVEFALEDGKVQLGAAAHVHTEEILQAVAPTCEEAGMTEGKKCTECGEITVKQESIPALGHKWVDATCEAAKTCSVCGKTDGKPAGHQYEDGVCSACGAAKPAGKPGDVNGDGRADYSDALLILRASIGLAELTEAQKGIADVNHDGRQDYSDALLILRASIGLGTLE